MKQNVGSADRAIRVIAGIAIIVLGIVMHSWWGLLGLLPIATGLLRCCGMYSLLGINTCSSDKSSATKA
jgi:hypothetical protein